MSSSMGDVLKWGLVAGGAYLAWRYFTGAASSTGAGSISVDDLRKLIAGNAGTPPPASGSGNPPAAIPPPVSLLDLLKAAAKGQVDANGKTNPDNWSYWYSHLAGRLPLDASVLDIWFPNGRPDDAAQYPQISAEEFVAGLATKGLSGLSAFLNRPLQMNRGSAIYNPQARRVIPIPYLVPARRRFA